MTTPSRDEAQTSDESGDDWRNDPSQHPSKSENQQEICPSKNVFRNDVCADNVRNSIDGCYRRAGILMVELDSSLTMKTCVSTNTRLTPSRPSRNEKAAAR